MMARVTACRNFLICGERAGLELGTEEPARFAEAQKAYEVNDLELVAEIQTHIWFDGHNRGAERVNPVMRKLAFDMNRLALDHEARKPGKHVQKECRPAVERLPELALQALVIVGQNDTAYLLVADYLESHLVDAKKVIIPNMANLTNMDQPQAFWQVLDSLLAEHQRWTEPPQCGFQFKSD